MKRVLSFVALATLAACSWDPRKPFEREAPAVRDAIRELDAGLADAAAARLTEYLATGACEQGNVGVPAAIRERPQATYDLGVALFRLGEAIGKPFVGQAKPESPEPARKSELECVLRLVRAIADDATLDRSIRARAHFLEGNALYLLEDYELAIKAYERALAFAPGLEEDDAGFEAFRADAALGRDVAHNRALALRLRDEQKDAGPDSEPPSDGGGDGGGDAANEGGSNDGGGDSGSEGGAPPSDGGSDPPQEAGAEPPPATPNERLLDKFERAPSVQQEMLRRATPHRVKGSLDR